MEENLEFPLNTALKENRVKPVLEFPSTQRLVSVNSHSLAFGVLMIWPGLKKKIGCECQGKFFNVCIGKLLTSLSRSCKLERGNPNRKSLFSTLPTCPPCHCFVVSSLLIFIYFCPPLTKISHYQGIHYPFV